MRRSSFVYKYFLGEPDTTRDPDFHKASPPHPNENPNLYIAWHGVPFTLEECQLACALSIYITFEDGTRLDDTTIGQVLGASSGLKNVNCAGLVAHLKETDNVYPAVLNGGDQWAQWARYKYNR